MLALPPPVLIKSFEFSKNSEVNPTAHYFFMTLSDMLRRIYEKKNLPAPSITGLKFFFCGLQDFRNKYEIKKTSVSELCVYTDGGVRVRAVLGKKSAAACNTRLSGLGVCFSVGDEHFSAASCIMETSEEINSHVAEIMAHVFGVLLSNVLFVCPDVRAYYDLESLKRLPDTVCFSNRVRKLFNALSHRGHYAPNGIMGHWYINVAHNMALLYQKDRVLDRCAFTISSGAMLLSKQNNTNFLKDCR